ncbi:GOLPH3/VPS74 family protein [Algivirga pacifica]|uniref:Golgi phosphoprotein 3 (GPP34) n=1 Tax=Algivirga pacifica TaxID=1162670 RepID=A0ABP9D3R9_9BACT
MKLTLIDQLVLLALDDEKGTFVSESYEMNYGIAAAILLELTLAEKIQIHEKRIQVLNKEAVANPILNRYLEEILDTRKEHTVTHWLERFAEKASLIKEDTLQHLVEQKILQKKEGTFLFIFHYDKYPTVDPQPENQLRKRLEGIVLYRQTPEAEELMLLSLINACQLEKEVFGKEDQKAAKSKIEQLIEQREDTHLIHASIEEIHEALALAVTLFMTHS